MSFKTSLTLKNISLNESLEQKVITEKKTIRLFLGIKILISLRKKELSASNIVSQP